MTSLVKDFIRRGGEGMRISGDREEDKIMRKNVILGYPQADILKEVVKDA